MEWLQLILLVIVIMVVNTNFKKISEGIKEEEAQYAHRFTDIEQRIAAIESTTKG